jgi:glutamyl-tRNA synthetase
MPASNRTSRLAPSPTGALHLGNARTFLVNWALARQSGWRLLMRIEDLDGPRVKPESAAQTLDILRWLGLDWDEDTLVQSEDLDPYRRAMTHLSELGFVYQCRATRKEIQAAASAPHADDHEIRFPPSLRPDVDHQIGFIDEHVNYRLLTTNLTIHVKDQFAGPSDHNPAEEVGDFLVWTKRGAPAYQLAVVVDDARQGVTDVVRGDDLLPSAARQEILYAALGRTPPTWWHTSLVLGPDGRRLAKRHGDSRLATYRSRGVSAERIIGLLASWSGVAERPVAMSARDFLQRFDPDRLPRTPITFMEDHHRWLLEGSST